MVAEREAEISEAEENIERLKAMIEDATLKIHDAEAVIGAAKMDAEEEISAIESLVAFCNGVKEVAS